MDGRQLYRLTSDSYLSVRIKNNILIITRRGHLAVLFSTKNNGDSVLDTHYQSKTAAESSDRQKNLLLALQLIYRCGSLGSRSLVLNAY